MIGLEFVEVVSLGISEAKLKGEAKQHVDDISFLFFSKDDTPVATLQARYDQLKRNTTWLRALDFYSKKEWKKARGG